MYHNHIRKIRKEKGFSLIKLAALSEISPGYLCHLEKGSRTNPSVNIMDKIAKALGKSIAEIFFE